MGNKHEVLWTKVAEDDLVSIIKYTYLDNPKAAQDNLKKIKNKASNLCNLPQRGRIAPELKDEGISQYRKLIVSPWRIIYHISELNVYVLLVIDSRKNVEGILLHRLVRKNNTNK